MPFPGAAGSAQARLAAGADGTPVLSWLEPAGDGVALRYAVFEAGAFGEPREITRGEDLFVNWADLPSVQPITADVWAAHWLRFAPDSAGAYHVATAVSGDGGRTWSAPVQLNDDSAVAEHGFVELFAWNDRVRRVLARRPAARRVVVRRAGQAARHELARRRARLLGPGRRARDRRRARLRLLPAGSSDDGAGPVVAYRDRTPEEIRDVVVRRHLTARGKRPSRPAPTAGTSKAAP